MLKWGNQDIFSGTKMMALTAQEDLFTLEDLGLHLKECLALPFSTYILFSLFLSTWGLFFTRKHSFQYHMKLLMKI